MPYKDPIKRREMQKKYLKTHYQNNKEYYLNRNKKRKIDNSKYVEELKKKSKCANCPENHIGCLDFHHLDESNKEFTISSGSLSISRSRLIKEIAKCIILCSNCHRKLHYEKRKIVGSTPRPVALSL